jgi:hypothetical protein
VWAGVVANVSEARSGAMSRATCALSVNSLRQPGLRAGLHVRTQTRHGRGNSFSLESALEADEAVQRSTSFAAMASEDAVRLPVDDGEGEALLVRDVVGER